MEMDKKTEELKDLPNKVLEDFLKLYRNMGENISDTHFDEFLEIIHKENITFPKEETVNLFRTNLVEQLTESFQKFWIEQQLPEKLSVMELLKERFKNNTNPQWRPHGKTPSEQTLPIRIKWLKKKQKFINKQMDTQKPILEATVEEIGTNRKRIEELIARREVLSYRIDEQSNKLKTVQEEIIKSQLQAIKLL